MGMCSGASSLGDASRYTTSMSPFVCLGGSAQSTSCQPIVRAVPSAARTGASDRLVSWNNKQAPDWAADDKYAFGPVFRSQLIADRVQQDIAGGQTMNIAQLVQAMEEPATEDIRTVKLWPILKQVLGPGGDTTVRDAVALLDQWYNAGGHRRDLTKSGRGQDTPAILRDLLSNSTIPGAYSRV